MSEVTEKPNVTHLSDPRMRNIVAQMKGMGGFRCGRLPCSQDPAWQVWLGSHAKGEKLYAMLCPYHAKVQCRRLGFDLPKPPEEVN